MKLIPAQRADIDLSHPAFSPFAVQYNLFFRISEGNDLIAVKSADQNVIAIRNIGHDLWFWLAYQPNTTEFHEAIAALCEHYSYYDIDGISAAPAAALAFAQSFALRENVNSALSMSIEAYECRSLQKLLLPEGECALPDASDQNELAAFCAGFVNDCYGYSVTPESKMIASAKLIASGNLYIWKVQGRMVAMANIAHRSARHARINYVYTPARERKKGYGSAIVNAICKIILREGRYPMLYADLANPDSNSIYRKIGFTPQGQIDNWKFAVKQNLP
jgi:GNAT superfamily N-acetyltransferase